MRQRLVVLLHTVVTSALVITLTVAGTPGR